MEIADAARKHGIADSDIEHAVRNAIRILNHKDRDLYSGLTAQAGCSRSWSSTTADSP